MRKELDEALSANFPNLYRDRNADKNKSSMHWGFECGSGWYPLLNRASAKLEKLILELPENKRKFYKATQVKQKFGGLRLYMYDRTQAMKDILADVEEESFRTCEACGRPGKLIEIPHRWVTVNCEEHKDLSHWSEMDKPGVHWSVKLGSYFKALLGQ